MFLSLESVTEMAAGKQRGMFWFHHCAAFMAIAVELTLTLKVADHHSFSSSVMNIKQ